MSASLAGKSNDLGPSLGPGPYEITPNKLASVPSIPYRGKKHKVRLGHSSLNVDEATHRELNHKVLLKSLKEGHLLEFLTL